MGYVMMDGIDDQFHWQSIEEGANGMYTLYSIHRQKKNFQLTAQILVFFLRKLTSFTPLNFTRTILLDDRLQV